MFLMCLPHSVSAIGCLLGIRIVHRKPIRCVFTDGRPFQFRLFFLSCLVWALLWLPGVLLFPGGLDDLKSRFHEIRPWSWPLACLTVFTVIFFQAAAEEIEDRSYLQTRLAAWVKRPWLAVCISTIVFTSLHTGEMNLPSRVIIVLIGLTLGIALIRANTIAPLIGMHATSNALGVLWLPDWTNTNRNWLDVVFRTIQLALWLKWLFWVTRDKQEFDDRASRKLVLQP